MNGRNEVEELYRSKETTEQIIVNGIEPKVKRNNCFCRAGEMNK
jgi:hypothetical protein